MSKHLMFVYGTLKKGQPNHHLLTETETYGSAEYVGRALTDQKWPLVITSKWNIPYLLYKQDLGKQIFGEVYSVDDKLQGKMDELECHPTYYTRLQTAVTLEDGSKCFPWIYFIKNFKPELLDLETFDDYSSYGKHGLPYVERCERNQTNDGRQEKYDVISDIKL